MTKGVAIGTRVLIGISVALAILLCLSLMDCFLWYRRHFRRTEENADPTPNTHELITDANRHELPAESKHAKHPAEEKKRWNSPDETDSKLYTRDLSSLAEPQPSSPYELDANPKLSGSIRPPSGAIIQGKDPAPASLHGKREEGWGIQSRRKQDIRERIRMKRERLWELTEENAKRDVLKRAGEGAGSSDN